MRTKMMRTRMRMITTRKNITREKIRTVDDEGCVVSLVFGCRTFLIVFMDFESFRSFYGHWTRTLSEGGEEEGRQKAR